MGEVFAIKCVSGKTSLLFMSLSPHYPVAPVEASVGGAMGNGESIFRWIEPTSTSRALMSRPRAPCERRSHIHTRAGLQDSFGMFGRLGSVRVSSQASSRFNGLAKHRFAGEPLTWHVNHVRPSPVLCLVNGQSGTKKTWVERPG